MVGGEHDLLIEGGKSRRGLPRRSPDRAAAGRRQLRSRTRRWLPTRSCAGAKVRWPACGRPSPPAARALGTADCARGRAAAVGGPGIVTTRRSPPAHRSPPAAAPYGEAGRPTGARPVPAAAARVVALAATLAAAPSRGRTGRRAEPVDRFRRGRLDHLAAGPAGRAGDDPVAGAVDPRDGDLVHADRRRPVVPAIGARHPADAAEQRPDQPGPLLDRLRHGAGVPDRLGQRPRAADRPADRRGPGVRGNGGAVPSVHADPCPRART